MFLLPAETAHYFAMNNLHYAKEVGIIKDAITKYFSFPDKALTKEIFGLPFKNPVGLGAGFDKNAKYLNELDLANSVVLVKGSRGMRMEEFFNLLRDRMN